MNPTTKMLNPQEPTCAPRPRSSFADQLALEQKRNKEFISQNKEFDQRYISLLADYFIYNVIQNKETFQKEMLQAAHSGVYQIVATFTANWVTQTYHVAQAWRAVEKNVSAILECPVRLNTCQWHKNFYISFEPPAPPMPPVEGTMNAAYGGFLAGSVNVEKTYGNPNPKKSVSAADMEC